MLRKGFFEGLTRRLAPLPPPAANAPPPTGTVRRPDGGERPVLVARADPSFAQGDTFTRQPIDRWNDGMTGRGTTAIEPLRVQPVLVTP